MLDSLMIPQFILKTLALSFRHVEINDEMKYDTVYNILRSLLIQVPYLQPSTYAAYANVCLASRWAAHRRQASPATLCPESMPRIRSLTRKRCGRHIWCYLLDLYTIIYIYTHYTYDLVKLLYFTGHGSNFIFQGMELSKVVVT